MRNNRLWILCLGLLLWKVRMEEGVDLVSLALSKLTGGIKFAVLVRTTGASVLAIHKQKVQLHSFCTTWLVDVFIRRAKAPKKQIYPEPEKKFSFWLRNMKVFTSKTAARKKYIDMWIIRTKKTTTWCVKAFTHAGIRSLLQSITVLHHVYEPQ